MNWDLPSAYPAAILMAALAAALLFHLTRLAGPGRLLHAAYAASAAGLIYILGAAGFGWRIVGGAALFWVYVALFALIAVYAGRRRAKYGVIGLPWLSALIQQGVLAYMFAPDWFRKPPVTAVLFLYFAFEALVWLRGREEEEKGALAAADATARPPLFPPKRRRGPGEISLAAVALAIAYLLFIGPRPVVEAPEAATAEATTGAEVEPVAASEEPPAAEATETASAETQPSAPETDSVETQPSQPESEKAVEAAPEPSSTVAAQEPEAAPPAAKADEVYSARAGDTFKSIAKRLYGKTTKWRALADANPDVKAKKFRAGQLIKLPSPPTR